MNIQLDPFREFLFLSGRFHTEEEPHRLGIAVADDEAVTDMVTGHQHRKVMKQVTGICDESLRTAFIAHKEMRIFRIAVTEGLIGRFFDDGSEPRVCRIEVGFEIVILYGVCPEDDMEDRIRCVCLCRNLHLLCKTDGGAVIHGSCVIPVVPFMEPGIVFKQPYPGRTQGGDPAVAFRHYLCADPGLMSVYGNFGNL